MPEPAPARRLLPVVATVAVSTAATLLVIELALRVASGTPLGRPSPARSFTMTEGRYPGAWDAELGVIPRPGYRGEDNVWRVPVTIGPDGLRDNGAPPPPGRPIVAVGDSFTFGDEVGDADTFPAQLERRLGRPVVNGGVFGYGFDQAVLRSERLLAHIDSDLLLVGLLPEDVLRNEFSYRYAWKPYFDVVDGALVRRNDPVPAPRQGPPAEAPWRRWLRWSFLGDLVMRRLDPQGWALPESVRAHRQGVTVGRLLVDRLADAADAGGHRVVLVEFYIPGSSDRPARGVVERARERGLLVVPVQPVVERALEQLPVAALYRVHASPGRPTVLGHMTPRGNALVAEAVALALERAGLAPPGS